MSKQMKLFEISVDLETKEYIIGFTGSGIAGTHALNKEGKLEPFKAELERSLRDAIDQLILKPVPEDKKNEVT